MTHRKCIEAIERAIDLWGEPYRLNKQCITEALAITMSSNNREIGGHHFTQIDGLPLGGQSRTVSQKSLEGSLLMPLLNQGDH